MHRSLLKYQSPSLLFLLPLLFLSTCKKDCKEESEGCEYEQGFEMVKDWMYFKTGSYWIYQEENSGAIDTITVWQDDEGQSSGGFDAFLCYTESTYDGYSYRYRYNQSFSIHCLTEPDCQCEKVDRSKSRPGDFVGSERNFVFPPVLGNRTAAGSGWSTVINVETTAEILPDDLRATVEFKIDDDNSEGGSETYFTIAKNVGVIERQIIDLGQVWRLVDYDVVQ